MFSENEICGQAGLVSGYWGRAAVSVIFEARSMEDNTLFSGLRISKIVMISVGCGEHILLKAFRAHVQESSSWRLLFAGVS